MNLVISIILLIVGGFITCIFGFFGRIAFEYWKIIISAKGIASQLNAEIQSILSIVKKRDYLNFVKKQIDECKQRSLFNRKQLTLLTINISPEHVIAIYKSNLDKLHLLKCEDQKNVVKFYQYLLALIEDVKPGGTFDSVNTSMNEKKLSRAEEFISIGYETVKLGNELTHSLDQFVREYETWCRKCWVVALIFFALVVGILIGVLLMTRYA